MQVIDARDRMRDLVERNSPDLLAYFARRVTPTEDAADLVGETLLTIWRRVADLPRDDTRARMWMFGVARRVLANHRRRRQRQLALADRLRGEIAVHTTSGDFSHVRDAIDALPEPQREIVLLVHGDGFNLAEAAKLMHVSASTTRTRYATALASLRAALVEVSPS